MPDKYRCVNREKLDDQNIAAAAIFYMCIEQLSDVLQHNSVQNKDSIQFYRRVSSLCSCMPNLTFLGGVNEYIGDLHPQHDLEIRQALTRASLFFDRLADALERSDRGVRWDHRDDHRSEFEQTALIGQGDELGGLPDPSSASATRARLSAFIEAADRVYDKPRLTGPLAQIASMVLGRPIDKKLIANCRRSLDRHRGPQTARTS